MNSDKKPDVIRVAIVEDDNSLRALFRGWIENAAGMTCVGDFPNAERAMVDLPKCVPDVVVMDINLPGRNGIECVRGLKPEMVKAQFMMLTMYGDSDLIFEALRAGATGYLLKRATREELLEAIIEISKGGSPMSSPIARMVAQSFWKPSAREQGIDKLAPQEQRVLEMISRGFFHKEIAAELGIGVPTVGTYVRRIYEKLQVHTRAQAIAKFRIR
jgi:DNA-binding NarL/FixJ family response regulator